MPGRKYTASTLTRSNRNDLRSDFMQPIDEGGISDSSRMALWFTIIVIGVQIVVALVAYPFLPAKIPSHWNAAGEINGYMPKWLGAFFPAGISIVMTVFLRGIVA